MAEDKSVDVKFGADTRGIKDGAAAAAQAVKGFADQVNGIGSSLKSALGWLTAGAVVAAISNLTTAMAELGDTTEDTAAMLGVSVERIGELEYIAEASGDSLESISTGMGRLAIQAAKAAAGGEAQAEVFRRLGVSVKNADGTLKDLDTLMGDVADSFAQHANGTEKTALAIELMGRSGAKLIPILNEGREGFEKLAGQAHETGIVLSANTVKGMMEVHYSLVQMQNAFQGLGIQVFNIFQPAIKATLDTISNLVIRFTDWADRSYVTGGAMRWLALTVAVVVSAVLTLIAAFELLWDFASGVIDALGSMMGDLGTMIASTLSGNPTVAWNPDKWFKPLYDIKDRMGQVLTDYKDTIKEMWAATLAPPQEITVGPDGSGLSPFGAPQDLQAMQDALTQLKQTVGEVKQTFQSFFSSVISGFDKAISGLITGTMDWKQAMFSVLDGIWSSFIGIIEDWVAKWLAGEATMLFAHESANAAKIASDMAVQDQAAAKMIMDAVKAILVDSKQTAAGVTANLAPTLGPAAIPAGLAAGASVAALASFDVGTMRVPRDMTANIHEGEVIIPAKNGMADAFREMMAGGGFGGGGGITNNFNGPVFDADKLAAVVTKAQQRNRDLRPAW